MPPPTELRILHLNTEPTWRGGEQQLLYLLDGLAERGVPSTLVAQPDGPMFERARASGHEVVGMRMRGEVDLPAKEAIKDPTAWVSGRFERFLGRPASEEELRIFVTVFHQEDCRPETIVYALTTNGEYHTY